MDEDGQVRLFLRVACPYCKCFLLLGASTKSSNSEERVGGSNEKTASSSAVVRDRAAKSLHSFSRLYFLFFLIFFDFPNSTTPFKCKPRPLCALRASREGPLRVVLHPTLWRRQSLRPVPPLLLPLLRIRRRWHCRRRRHQLLLALASSSPAAPQSPRPRLPSQRESPLPPSRRLMER